MFIARVGRENEQLVCSSICFITDFLATKCRFRVLHVGGTLEKIELKYKAMSEAWLENTNKKLEIKFTT